MNIFKAFFKKFKAKEKLALPDKTMKNNLKTFDIIVIDLDDNGKPIQHPENGVKATSARELVSLYKNCGQDIRIVKEYPSPAEIAVHQVPQASGNLQAATEQYQKVMPPIAVAPNPPPIKYFTVGGIDCKLENGKVYQKQWVKLVPAEAENIRVISDANNKVMNMNGKHIEMQKWVLADTSSDTISTTENVLLKG